MNGTPNSSGSRNSPSKTQPARSGVLPGAILFAVVIIGVILAFKSFTSAPKPEPLAPVASVPEVKTHPALKATPSWANFPAPSPVAVPAPAMAVQPEPRSPAQLVDELTELSGTRGPITKEQAERFKEILAELVQQGASAVPAIQDSLNKNANADYAEMAGGDQLGYSSLRASLIDTLKQIGGPEAQAATLQTLQTTAVPSEVLELAKNLEQQSPGQFRDQILNAAQEALDMASANQLGTNVEVGPIFRVLQMYGDPGTHGADANGAHP
ncbi:hypothetical protein [Pedosphaera parvula]|uniref:Uncharacterized protein n=1 Tax=Pedosphaera parvula (strain Ellin514) TaxID=320771 RepID=B9XDV5_PEDPL|nr:hypothetical protein [Pedosphaera parvula]EEF61846.1 hypothetical protein Cflav_PD4509 [Pedosphaera parvula Ellin514]